MTREIVIFAVLLGILLGLLFYWRWQQSRYLKKRNFEAMSASLRKEIEAERQGSLERRKKFEDALKKAEGRNNKSISQA